MSRTSLAFFVCSLGILAFPARVQAQGALAFQPVVSPLMDGASLNATAVVSHDRRYVRLNVNPIFNSNVGFQTFPVVGVVGGVGGGGGGLPGAGGGGGGGMRSVPGGVGFAGMNGPTAGFDPRNDRPLASLASPFYDPALLAGEGEYAPRPSKLQLMKAKRRKGLQPKPVTAPARPSI